MLTSDLVTEGQGGFVHVNTDIILRKESLAKDLKKRAVVFSEKGDTKFCVFWSWKRCVLHLESLYKVNVEAERMYFSMHPSFSFEKVMS